MQPKYYQFFENQIAKQNEESEWLTSREAAAFLRLTPNALRIQVHRGKLKAYKLGRHLRFRRKDLKPIFREIGE